MKTRSYPRKASCSAAELRERDRIERGQQFSIDRLEEGRYLLKRMAFRNRPGLTRIGCWPVPIRAGSRHCLLIQPVLFRLANCVTNVWNRELRRKVRARPTGAGSYAGAVASIWLAVLLGAFFGSVHGRMRRPYTLAEPVPHNPQHSKVNVTMHKNRLVRTPNGFSEVKCKARELTVG